MFRWINVSNHENDYFLKYRFVTPNMQPLEAAYHTINHITKNYPPPYTLMLSGGVDSQAMLYAWHTSNIPYQTFSGVYNKNLNENDLSTLDQFSKNHNILIKYVDVDVLNFLEHEHVDYVYKYRCGSPHMTTYMKMIEMIPKGTPILSGNFIKYNTKHLLPISRNLFGLYKFALKNQKPLVPFFFCETQELACSFVKEYSYKDFTSNETKFNNAKDHEYYDRVLMYNNYGFPVIPQSAKLTGFELIKDYYDENFKDRVTVKDKLFRTKHQNSKRVFDLLLRNKYETLFSVDKYIVTASME